MTKVLLKAAQRGACFVHNLWLPSSIFALIAFFICNGLQSVHNTGKGEKQ